MFSKGFGRIKKTGQEIEPHEVFLDKLAQKKEEEIGFSEGKFELPLSQKKLKIFYFLSLAMIAFFFAKVFQFQVIEGKKFSELSEKNVQRLYLVQPTRGVIYDSSMKQLVFNKPSYDLVVNIKELPWPEQEKRKIITEILKVP